MFVQRNRGRRGEVGRERECHFLSCTSFYTSKETWSLLRRSLPLMRDLVSPERVSRHTPLPCNEVSGRVRERERERKRKKVVIRKKISKFNCNFMLLSLSTDTICFFIPMEVLF